MPIIDNPTTFESPVWHYFVFRSENGKDVDNLAMVVCKHVEI